MRDAPRTPRSGRCTSVLGKRWDDFHFSPFLFPQYSPPLALEARFWVCAVSW